MEIQEKYMKEALKQARKAYKLGEVPIGCVIVYGDKIIARGYSPARCVPAPSSRHGFPGW